MDHNTFADIQNDIEAVRFLPPAAALAWSEAQVDSCQPSDIPCLAFWRPLGVTVAVGLSQDIVSEIHLDNALRNGVDIVRRQSGGGAVLLNQDVLCWEAWAPIEAIGINSGIHASYDFFSRPILNALEKMEIHAYRAGICDISISDSQGNIRKIAGTAQLRRRQAVLVHGSILVDVDMDQMDHLLKHPSSEPEYRSGRSHSDFCTTLKSLTCLKHPGHDLTLLAEQEAQKSGWMIVRHPLVLTGKAADLLVCKYMTDAWNIERKRQNSPARP